MSPGVLSILYDVRLTLFLPSCTPRQDALAAFSEAAKIFIHYLTSTASDMCQETKRSTITADDVIKAVHELDFGDLVPPLEGALEVFRAQMKERNEKKLAATKATKKRKAEEATADQGKGEGEGATVEADGAGGVEVAAAGAEGGAATDAEAMAAAAATAAAAADPEAMAAGGGAAGAEGAAAPAEGGDAMAVDGA